MKNSSFLIAIIFLTSSFVAIGPVEKSNEFTYAQITNMSYHDVEMIVGRKLGIKEKMSLKLIQKELKKQIKNGTLDGREKVDFKNYYEPRKGKFVASAFFLGLLLGLVGVIIVAYTSKKKDDISSAWMGFAALAMIVFIFYLKATNAI